MFFPYYLLDMFPVGDGYNAMCRGNGIVWRKRGRGGKGKGECREDTLWLIGWRLGSLLLLVALDP